MPRTKKRSSGNSRRKSTSAKQNAIELLKADHREVENLFAQFEKARNDEKKSELAQKICQALKVHSMIEEEIFYPAFVAATGDEETEQKAEVEHDSVKKLIAEIEESGSEDELFDARVKVLSELVEHHVEEEESSKGMFGEAKKSDMDLAELAQQLDERKQELMSGGTARSRRGATSRAGMQGERTQRM